MSPRIANAIAELLTMLILIAVVMVIYAIGYAIFTNPYFAALFIGSILGIAGLAVLMIVTKGFDTLDREREFLERTDK